MVPPGMLMSTDGEQSAQQSPEERERERGDGGMRTV